MAINIPLIDKWRIRSDKHQFMLVREQGEREIIEGYYPDLESCISSFVEKKIKQFDSTSIHSLLESIKSLQTRLNRALQPLKLEVKPIMEAGK